MGRCLPVLLFALVATPVRADDATALARACYLETTWNPTDCAAVVHVLLRRARQADVTPAAMAYAYSLRKPTARAAYARALPSGLRPADLPRWQALVAVAEGVIAGEIANPCPRAVHWGSPRLAPDLARARRAIAAQRWVVVRCRGRTANTFYAKAPKR